MKKRSFKYKFLRFVIVVSIIFVMLILAFRFFIIFSPPEIENTSALDFERKKVAENFYTCEGGWLKKNKYGLWEMQLSGDGFVRGVQHGLLAQELVAYQEEVFVKSIQEKIPSRSYLDFLKYFIAIFHRNLDEYVPKELQEEIYGVSRFAPEEYDFIGPAYYRMLSYHAAHDIGHTLQNMNLVACTAFAVKNDRSADSLLLVGRNMDFSSGDDFAENKIITFVKPDQGHNFCYITWGGFTGVVSGMNQAGLSVTLNAAKSDIPFSAKTPVSILARQVVQYASTIDEAFEIIKNNEVFVSESFLISSAKDRKTVVIEKSSDKIGIFDTQTDELILTNHFQSDTFKNSKLTKENIESGASLYRWKRVRELLSAQDKHDVKSFVGMLRDRKGIGGKDIGMGNEKAINQLIAHHSVVMKPELKQIWISTNPYQLGHYLMYDLDEVFSDSLDVRTTIYSEQKTVASDSFLYTQQYTNFEHFKKETKAWKAVFGSENLKSIPEQVIENYMQLNPEYYYTHFIAGEFYRLRKDTLKARQAYEKALEKEIPRTVDREQVLEALKMLTPE